MIKKLLVALCAFAFISQTDALAQGTSDKNHNFKVAKNLETFSAIYKYLDMMYVDTLNADEVIGNGINVCCARSTPTPFFIQRTR